MTAQLARRDFLAALAAAPLATQAAQKGALAPAALVIDALGEIHTDYDDALLDEVLASGLRGCVVTVGNPALQGASAFDDMQAELLAYDRHIATKPSRLQRATSVADLEQAAREGRLALLYYTQNASPIGDDVKRLNELERLGVRMVQLTYNTRNLLGDGCLERVDGGLSNLGRDLVAELNRTRVVMDLSHSGARTIAEAIMHAKAPPVISHTGCRDVTDHPRNVFDTELRALAAKGGVAGIYFMPFLVAHGAARKDDLIRHIEHAVNVCGEDHVGLGTDGNISPVEVNDEYREGLRQEHASRVAQGIAAPGEGPDAHQFILDYNEPRRFLRLAEDLSQRSWTSGRIEKLLGANFARVYGEVWG